MFCCSMLYVLITTETWGLKPICLVLRNTCEAILLCRSQSKYYVLIFCRINNELSRDATVPGIPFNVKDFVVSTYTAVIGRVIASEPDVKVC